MGRMPVTVEQFCHSGNQEVVKGGVHGAACVVALVMAAYNIAAWCFRRDRHLRVNAVVYTLAVGWELKQTLHHLRACEASPPTEYTDASQPESPEPIVPQAA